MRREQDGERTRVFSAAPWEPLVGYCRAMRVGPMIWVTGTAPVADDGSVFAPGDPAAQTRRCLDLIERALGELGAGLEHVVRTRMFVTDIAEWEAIGRARGERFRAHPPCTTMVEVSALIDPAMRIEIEADAYLPPR